MMKGIQRKMIVVRTESNPYFDEAHFLLRRDADPSSCKDILGEANRIVEESLHPYLRRNEAVSKKVLGRYLFLFLAGLAVGGGIIALVLLL